MKVKWWLLALLLGPVAVATAQQRNLDIYWIDVEGGAATLMVAPSGESLLVDSGCEVGDRNAKQTVGAIDVYEGKKVISDGTQSLEPHAFTGSPHAEPMVLAYVPSAKALFQSDLWFPGTGGAGTPAAKQLLESIRALKLKVDTNVGGHGGVAPFAELEKAVAAMK